MENSHIKPSFNNAIDVYRASDRKLVFIDAVFARPAMYTINGTLEEVAAFLQGFYIAIKTYDIRREAQIDAMHWFEFCKWANKHISGIAGDCYQLFTIISQIYSGNQAFIQLALLHIAFQEKSGDFFENDRIIENIALVHNNISPKNVFLHPKDYTISATIEEVVSFLEGYYSGKYAHRSGDSSDAMWWFDFCRWAFLRITGEDRMPAHRQLCSTLRELYGDDDKIRKVTLRLIDDFLDVESFPSGSR